MGLYMIILAYTDTGERLSGMEWLYAIALSLISWSLVFLCILATIDFVTKLINKKDYDRIIRGNNPNIQDDIDTTQRLPKTTITID